MLRRLGNTVRRGAITGKTVAIYGLLWLLGVPGLLLILLFALGVGH